MEIPGSQPQEPLEPIKYKRAESSKRTRESEGFDLPKESGILEKTNVTANIKKLNELGKMPRVLQESLENVSKQDGKIGPYIKDITGPTSNIMGHLFKRAIYEKGE